MEPRVERVQVVDQPIRQRLASQRLGDHERIPFQGVEQFPEDPPVACLRRHTIHFGLELFRRDRAPPGHFKSVRFPEVVDDLRTNGVVSQRRRQRRLRLAVLRGPDAVVPVDLLDRFRRDTVLEGESTRPSRVVGGTPMAANISVATKALPMGVPRGDTIDYLYATKIKASLSRFANSTTSLLQHRQRRVERSDRIGGLGDGRAAAVPGSQSNGHLHGPPRTGLTWYGFRAKTRGASQQNGVPRSKIGALRRRFEHSKGDVER